MLLVHVAGNADLGVPLARGGVRRSAQDLDSDAGRRLAELESCGTGAEAGALLFDLAFAHAVGEDEEDDRHSDPTPGSALRKELHALFELGERVGGIDDSTEILVIGVEGERTPTARLSRALVRALRLAASEGSHFPGLADVRVLDPVLLMGLGITDKNMERLEDVIGGHDGHVLLALAGGANTVFAEIAGVTTSTHGDEWSLVLVDRADDDASADETPLIDMSVPEDPLRGWLMGLGLPTVLADLSETADDEEVLSAAQTVRRAVCDGSRAVASDPDDLAQLLLADTARGDLAAGMASRAWVVAEYRRRLRKYREKKGIGKAEHPDVTLDDRGGEQLLGPVVRSLECRDAEGGLDEPEAWLVRQTALIEFGKRSTHDFESPVSGVDEALRDRVRDEVGNLPRWLSWPSGRVCLLTAQGGRSGAGAARRRPPVAATILSRGPHEQIRRACAISGELNLEVLLASSNSEGSVEGAREVAARLKEDAFPRNREWNVVGDDDVTVHDYGSPMTADGARVADVTDTMENLGRWTLEWLESRSKPPRAVVVTVLGEKEAVIALLRAAQTFGARHGIPVFLVSSVSEGSEERLQFHQFGLDRDVRQALIKAAQHCLDRLDLLTVVRLLALGDPTMEELSGKASVLADDLVRAVRTRDPDSCVGTILGVMKTVAARIDKVPADAQLRLVTIVSELLRFPTGRKRGPGFRPPVILAVEDGGFDRGYTARGRRRADLFAEPPEAMLRLLMRVRNKIPLNHGKEGLAEAVRTVLKNYRQGGTCSYARLLSRAVACIEAEHPETGAAGWERKLSALRRRMNTL